MSLGVCSGCGKEKDSTYFPAENLRLCYTCAYFKLGIKIPWLKEPER